MDNTISCCPGLLLFAVFVGLIVYSSLHAAARADRRVGDR